jgi:hypothetical protein
MPVTLVSQNILRETLQNEISLTKGFEDLSKALLDIASNRIARGLQGESDDARLSESLDKFKRSVIDKAWSSKIKIPADTASDYIDRYFAVRAHKLQSAHADREYLANAVRQVLNELNERIGEVIAHKKGAKLVVIGEDIDSKNEALEKYKASDENVILVDKDAKGDAKQSGKGVPAEIFGEEIDDSGFEWQLTETVKRLYCEEETPGAGKDDIIFQGTYVYRATGPLALRINPAEVDYAKGDSHFYNTRPYPPPHTFPPITLRGENEIGPSLYISTHLITESDQWTELAEIIAGFLRDAVQNPFSQLSNAFSGVTSGVATGLGAATAVGGAALDALTNNLSGGLLEKAGKRVYDTFYKLISSIGIESNIIFDTWFTAALIRWEIINGVKTPKWEVRHYAVGNSKYNRPAEPEDDNPKTGAGYLYPSRFANTPDVVLKPQIYDEEEYKNITGKYWYESTIQVVKKYYDN